MEMMRMAKSKKSPVTLRLVPRPKAIDAPKPFNWQRHARRLAELWLAPGLPVPKDRAHAEYRAMAVACAESLSRWLDVYKQALANGNTERAGYAAFVVGETQGRMSRHIEAFEVSRAEIRSYARLGGQAKRKANPAWQGMIEAKLAAAKKNGSRRSYSDVCDEIGKQSNPRCSGKCVRDHTTNPCPKKKRK